MAAKPQSWKKVRDERRKENFVGRGEPIRIFAENLQSDSPDYMVISITGEGGVGKSTLLARFDSIATSPEFNATVVICDDKQTSPVLAMGHIAKKLAEKGISHKEFDERYKKYSELRQELESDPKVPRGGINLLAMGITDLTIKSLRKTPGVGVFFEYADEKAAGEALAELMQYSISKWGNKDEVKLLREPEQVLTPLFLELIKKAYDDNKILIMYDVFERTSDALSPWLLMLFNFEYGEFDTRVMFVVSGRESLEQHWTELAGIVCHNSLEPFNLDELRLYLSNHEITDDALVNQIYEDTNGLPVLVELLAAAKPKPGTSLPDVSKDAVERFLQWTPQEERRQAALYASIPRQFNKDIISAIFGEDATALFNWLSAQSYVRSNNERGSFYHEKVRELMVRYLKHTEPQRISDIHEKLTAYFQEQQTNLNLQNKEVYENATWQKLEVERIYHMIAVDPEMHLAEVTTVFLTVFRWHWQYAEQIAQICIQVGDELQFETIASRGQELLNIHRAYQQDEHSKLIDRLTALSNQKGLTSLAKSICYARRARAKRILENYEEAIKDYERAIELDPEYSLFYGLGETYRLMGRFDEAIQNFNSELEIEPDNIESLTSRALAYRSLGKYEEASKDFSSAIEIVPKYDWAIAQRGETYRQAQRYEEALKDYTTAIEMEKVGWYFALRGYIYKDLEKYDEARKNFDAAIEINPKYGFALANRADTYLITSNPEQAEKDFTLAIEADPKVAWYVAGRGLAYQRLKNYDEALKDFTSAIEIDPEYHWALAQRGETYRLKEVYEEAIQDFSKAISLNQTTAWYWGTRGSSYYLIDKYEEAVSDLNEAIKLDPNYTWALANRANAYRMLRKHDDALKDLDKAIELDGSNAWYWGIRGASYQSLYKYDEAISDYTRALEIDPKHTFSIISRGVTLRHIHKQKDAVQNLDHAIEIGTDSAWALAERSTTFQEMGKYRQALKDINRAIKLEANNTGRLIERGTTYRMMGKFDKALEDYDAAISNDPQNTRAIANKGILFRMTGKFQEALENLDKAIEINPKYDWAFAQRGRTFEVMGKYKNALEDLNVAIEIDTRDSWLFWNRSKIYCKLEDYASALEDINKSLEIEPSNYYSTVRRASLIKRSGNTEDALRSVEFLLSSEPLGLWESYSVAIAYLIHENIGKTLELLKKAFNNCDTKMSSRTDDLLGSIRDVPEFKSLYD